MRGSEGLREEVGLGEAEEEVPLGRRPPSHVLAIGMRDQHRKEAGYEERGSRDRVR